MFDAAAADERGERRRLVRLRHDPHALLDAAVPASALRPAPGEIGVLVDATTRPVRVHVVAD